MARTTPPDPDAPIVPTAPYIVVGALRAPTGLGEAARLAALALAAEGVPFAVVDVSASLMQPLVESAPEGSLQLNEATGCGTLLLFVNPPTVADALNLIPKAVLTGKRRIGCWVWEHSGLEPEFRQQARLIDEIAAPSEFSARFFTELDRPVRVLIHPVAVRSSPLAVQRMRETTTLGMAFDMGSTAARKNPWATLEAFEAAFAVDDKVHLSIRVRDLESDVASGRELRRRVAQLGERASLFTGDAPRAAISEWLASLDLFVSLHRSEGFGLWIAEAMLVGVPVLSTDWSATTEWVDEEVGYPVAARLVPVKDASGRYDIPGATWAEPDRDAAAVRLNEAVSHPEFRMRRGERARIRAMRLFSARHFVEQLTRVR